MTRRVRIRIDRLVLDGLAADPAAVARALRTELARLVAAERRGAGPAVIGRLDAGAIPAGSDGGAVGRHAAAAIHRMVSVSGGGRR